MSGSPSETPLPQFGGWDDAERLRKWSFLRRTPQQRLDWLVEALTIAYQRGAITPAAGGAAQASVARPEGAQPAASSE